jgi:hypothetical protein
LLAFSGAISAQSPMLADVEAENNGLIAGLEKQAVYLTCNAPLRFVDSASFSVSSTGRIIPLWSYSVNLPAQFLHN